MKLIIPALCLVGLGLSQNLNLDCRIDQGGSSYIFDSNGGFGDVRYYVSGLPQGAVFDGNRVSISPSTRNGSHNFRVVAVDEVGQSVDQFITLQISGGQVVSASLSNSNGGSSSSSVSTGSSSASSSSSSSATSSGTVLSGNTVGGSTASSSTGSSGASTAGSTGSSSGNVGRNININIVTSNGSTSGSGSTTTTTTGGSTGSSPSTTAVNTNRLTKIISTHSTTQVKRPDYGNTNRYPEIQLPTGPSQPNLPNPTTFRISTQQAPVAPSNRNPITSDDVSLRIASDRYQNAIKGITNLLKIIDQARANRNKAQVDIQIFTQAYNDAVTQQRNSQNAIIGLQTRSSQIISATNNLIALIDDLRNKINQTVSQRESLGKQKTSALSIVTDLQGQKAGLIDKLKGLDNDLAANVKALSDKGSECQSANDAVSNKEKELAENQKNLETTNAARAGAIADIESKNALVQTLRKKLAEAQDDLSKAKIRLADIDAIRRALPGKIADLQKELEGLRAKANACAAEVARIQAIIDNLKGNKYPELTKAISDLDSRIGTQRTKVSDLDSQLAGSQGPLEDLKAKLAQAQEDLDFIRNQKTEVDQSLRRAYQNGNDANSRVAFAKQNLDAIIKRFQDQSKIVSDATLNLQRARAQQALAKTALDEFVLHYSDALPYTIVPNGNGVGAGTPWGNNPSGAALGAVRNDGNGASGSFRINSWVNYLSSAYGAGVSPAFTGSVTELFPFNFSSKVSGNLAVGTIVTNGSQKTVCGSNTQNLNNRVASGVVTAVRDDSFDITTKDGQNFRVNVAPCTLLNANTPGYSVETGDQAVVKGTESSNRVITARQVTCLNTA